MSKSNTTDYRIIEYSITHDLQWIKTSHQKSYAQFSLLEWNIECLGITLCEFDTFIYRASQFLPKGDIKQTDALQ